MPNKKSPTQTRSCILHWSTIPVLLALLANTTSLQAQVAPEETVKQFKHDQNLEVTLWASEPQLSNPTSLDIDSRGRIWVTEGLNYRLFRSKDFKRIPGADKIKILEDTDQDGVADKVTVFAENLFPVPMGLAIEEIYNRQGEQTGTRIYVGNAPNLLVLEDTDGDDKADKKYNLLTGFGALDSDHGLHGLFLAMDGKLYFTHGDGKHGEPEQYKNMKDPDLVFDIVDQSGRGITHKDRGSTLRINTDGTNLEILGIRFRNNYEVAVDSLGRVFVSDNDDDGNRGSRMAWVMRGGNYGYQIPESGHHWAEDLPGYVPKIAGTGNGSPAGILVYEGDLFGKNVKGSVLQIDARTRQLNLHPLTRVDGGIRTEYQILLTGEDPWCRLIDAAVGPDGAIYLIDWYDAGVGGNRFVDQTTGRIYRFAPEKTPIAFEKPDFKTIEGLIEGIQSPVNATRFAAGKGLVERKSEALEPLATLYRNGELIMKGRALQVLSGMGEEGKLVLKEGLENPDPSIRELCLQLLARDLIDNKFEKNPGTPVVNTTRLSELLNLKDDPDAGVRRELLSALQDVPESFIKKELVELALAWDGQDRYYLEAVLIAFQDRSDEIKKVLLDRATENALASKELLKRDLALPPYFPTATNDGFLRPDDHYPTGNPASILIGLAWGLEWEGSLENLELLVNATDSQAVLKGVELAASRLPAEQAGDFFAKQFLKTTDISRRSEILKILGQKYENSNEEAFRNPLLVKIIEDSLKDKELRSSAIRLVGKIRTPRYIPVLMETVSDQSQPESVRASAIDALGRLNHSPLSESVVSIIEQTKETNNVTPLVQAAVRAYANLNGTKAIPLIKKILEDPDHGIAMKREAIKVLASTQEGAKDLIQLASSKAIPDELYAEVVSLTHNHPDRNIRRNARDHVPLPPSKSGKPLPPVAELISRSGDPVKGEEVFFRKSLGENKALECSSCHRVQGRGNSIGPDLSTIGVKFGKSELLESILNPSGAISYNYQTEIFQMEDGRLFQGLVHSETQNEFILKTAQKETITLDKTEIEARQLGSNSIMPEGLARLTTDEELIDLLAYLATLRKPSVAITQVKVLELYSSDSGNQEHWEPHSADQEGKISLDEFSSGQVLLRFRIESSLDQSVKLVVETDAPLKLWHNKAEIPVSNQITESENHIVELDLKKGTHEFQVGLTPTSSGKPVSITVVSEVAVQVKTQ